jgi:O-antigen/teichoic acid export membrane protein
MNRVWIRYLPAFIRERVEGREYLQNVIGNTGWQFADQVLRMGVGLVIWIWLARYLGPEQFGLFSFALAFAALFSPLASLGLDDIVVRNLVRDPASGNETLGTAFILKLIGGSASFIAAVIAIFILRPADRVSHVLVAIIATGAAFQAFNAVEFWFNSQVQAKYAVFAKNAAFLSCALLKIALILAGASLVAFAWVGALEVIAGAAALMAAYRWRGNRIREWRSSLTTAKSLLSDSWPLVFSCIVIMIYLRIDQVMLGEMVGSEEVGVYSVAVRMAEVWFFIPSAIYWSVLPSLVDAKETGDALFKERLQKYYNLMALMAYAIAIPVTLLAGWLVPVLFGAPYSRAGIMLAVLIWANLFTYLEIARSAFFNVMNWNRIYFVTLALGAVLNVILNLFLIPRYGGLGAAIASCISYWFAAHGACFLYKPLRETGFMLTKAMIYPKIW